MSITCTKELGSRRWVGASKGTSGRAATHGSLNSAALAYAGLRRIPYSSVSRTWPVATSSPAVAVRQAGLRGVHPRRSRDPASSQSPLEHCWAGVHPDHLPTILTQPGTGESSSATKVGGHSGGRKVRQDAPIDRFSQRGIPDQVVDVGVGPPEASENAVAYRASHYSCWGTTVAG
jgi:hypothetical protein